MTPDCYTATDAREIHDYFRRFYVSCTGRQTVLSWDISDFAYEAPDSFVAYIFNG